MSDTQQPGHPEFGEFLDSRRRIALPLIGAFLLTLIGLLVAVPGVALAVSTGSKITLEDRLIGLGLVLLSVLFWIAVYQQVRDLRTRTVFYELGVVRRRGRSEIAIRYDEIKTFRFHLRRQYYRGIYIGSVVKLRLATNDKRSIAYTGSYKVKKKGFVRGSYEDRDPLGQVRQIIAERMADGLIQRILSGETVDWAKSAVLNADGIMPLRGRSASTTIPYAQIDRQSFGGEPSPLWNADGTPVDRLYSGKVDLFGKGYFKLYKSGDRKHFVRMSANTDNFWPGYAALLLIHRVHQGTSAGGADAPAVELA